MLKKLVIIGLVIAGVTSHAVPRRGQYVGSMGVGIVFDADLFLLSPQLEYVHNSTLRYGGLIQLGLSSGTLATISASLRYTIPTRRPKLQPFIEGALGLAMASGLGDNFGVHIMAGMGLDYELLPDFSLGTTFRFNFTPPIDNFFVSWPIAVARLTF